MLEINPKIPTIKIHEPDFLNQGVEVFIRREDLNHPWVSGNKLRKLKYNLLEAKKHGFETILTFGGAFSNHILATAAAGKESGLKTIGVIRGEHTEPLNPTLTDARDFGMHLHYMERARYRDKNHPSVIKSLEDEFGTFYLVPEGGTNEWALPGVQEMIDWEAGVYSHICCPVGTGGTLSGLISGGRREEQFLGFSVLKNAFSLDEEVDYLAGPDPVSSWSINHDYHFGGYAKFPEVLKQFIEEFEARHDIPLDPIYTCKMLFGVSDLIRNNYFPKGSRILAIHTGGLQGKRGFF